MLNLFSHANNHLVGLSAPLQIGLEDGIGPTSIIGLAVFFLFVSFFAYTRGLVLLYALFYCISVVVAKLLLIFGSLDRWLADSWINNLIVSFYIGIGVIFVFVGAVHFIDWFLLKRYDKRKFFIPLPVFVTWGLITSAAENVAKKLSYFYVWFLLNLIAFIGLITTVLGSVWTQDYELFLIIFIAREKQTVAGIYVEAFLVGLVSVIPIVVVAVILWFLAGSKSKKMKIYESPSLLKVVYAGIFLAVGAGTLFMFGYN